MQDIHFESLRTQIESVKIKFSDRDHNHPEQFIVKFKPGALLDIMHMSSANWEEFKEQAFPIVTEEVDFVQCKFDQISNSDGEAREPLQAIFHMKSGTATTAEAPKPDLTKRIVNTVKKLRVTSVQKPEQKGDEAETAETFPNPFVHERGVFVRFDPGSAEVRLDEFDNGNVRVFALRTFTVCSPEDAEKVRLGAEAFEAGSVDITDAHGNVVKKVAVTTLIEGTRSSVNNDLVVAWDYDHPLEVKFPLDMFTVDPCPFDNDKNYPVTFLAFDTDVPCPKSEHTPSGVKRVFIHTTESVRETIVDIMKAKKAADGK